MVEGVSTACTATLDEIGKKGAEDWRAFYESQ